MRPFVLVRDVFLIAFIIALVCLAQGWLSWWWSLILGALYLLALVLGAIFIRWNFFIPARHHGDRHSKLLALSFDDGPAAHTADILDVLQSEGVPAAFFTIGQRAAASPEIVKRWHDEAHLIGNHSYAHSFHFDWQSREKMVAEIRRTNETVKDITGKTPLLFRPPYGVTNPELSHAVNLTGMHTIGWSLRSFDTSAKDPDKLLQKLLKKVKGGDIILLHDSVAHTASILTALINACRQKGFTFVRLDKMLGIEAYA
jgi:peptidoglycan/xylan/chitin deacetylase (PgdA/CDA1 family)